MIEEARALAGRLAKACSGHHPDGYTLPQPVSDVSAASTAINALVARVTEVEGVLDTETRRLSSVCASLATATKALRTLVSHLNSCRHHERGAGGMTINAQIDRSVLLDVRQRWVVDAEEMLAQIESGTVEHPDSVRLREAASIIREAWDYGWVRSSRAERFLNSLGGTNGQ